MCTFTSPYLQFYSCSFEEVFFSILKYFFNQKYNKSQEKLKIVQCTSILNNKRYIWMPPHVGVCCPWMCDQNIYTYNAHECFS